MHPKAPALNGKVMDDPNFNTAFAMIPDSGDEIKLKDRNLLQAIVDVCEQAGGGFVAYMWPNRLLKKDLSVGVFLDLLCYTYPTENT